MNIAILGAGNIAWHISKALIKEGHKVLQIWNRSVIPAKELALLVGAELIESPGFISEEVELIIIAVNDEAISTVAAQLKLKDHQIVVHTSGSTSISVLEPFAKQFGVFYPLQTFSKGIGVNFLKIPLCIEANSSALASELILLGKDLSQNVQLVTSEQRLKLHIAAVFSCNFTNYFYSIAQQLLGESNLDFNLIRPLIASTANKINLALPLETQTGPARRNDQQTITKHLESLGHHPEWKFIYQIISQDIVKMYSENPSSDK
jgi:predicted short-subunit dehydrogenase-like oxidoreductase (DUF2520 family)